MKKIVLMIIVALSCLMLTSCATTVTAETSVASTIEYYDYLNGYIVVYIDGIPSYRFWDAALSRYYYRPVPRERFSYIRNRPVPTHRHHPNIHHGRRPDVHHHHGNHYRRPTNHRPDVMPNQPRHDTNRHPGSNRSFGLSSTRVTAPRSNNSHSGSGHFGGRR